jgi:hypothetical protein
MIKRTTNKKNKNFAIVANALAIPPKPKRAAINATTRKTNAQYNIIYTYHESKIGGGYPP